MPKLLIAALVLFAGFLAWRHWSRRRRAAFIAGFAYASMLDQRLAARRPDLSAAQRAEIFAALVDYFQICRVAGRRMVSMPSQAVDDAWHEFILFTRHYDRFCRQAFGRFLHHTPAEAMRSPTEAGDGLRRAWRLACARERIDPRAPQRLPRLFAIDAALGIADGFVYRLDCLAANKGAVGNAYCASHIGCGGNGDGGCSGDAGGGADGDGSGSDGGGGGGCGGGCGGGGD